MIIKIKGEELKKKLKLKDGYTPVKDKDYFDGDKGDKGNEGDKGDEGKQGSTDKPEEIRDKLEALKGDERIDESAIKGLDEKLEKNKKVIIQRVGGGGMNAWVHQSFNVSSSTTTISLSNAVGASGLAIFVYYQGQFIVRGTHYTIETDGKIISLTFTPDNNTVVDVVYLIMKRIL